VENELNQVHKTKRTLQTFFSKLIWQFCYKQRSCHEEISEKTTITSSDD